MKKLLTGLFAMVTMCSLCAQVTVTPGGSMEFVLKKQPLYHVASGPQWPGVFCQV